MKTTVELYIAKAKQWKDEMTIKPGQVPTRFSGF